jgi:hypothetical protein
MSAEYGDAEFGGYQPAPPDGPATFDRSPTASSPDDLHDYGIHPEPTETDDPYRTRYDGGFEGFAMSAEPDDAKFHDLDDPGIYPGLSETEDPCAQEYGGCGLEKLDAPAVSEIDRPDDIQSSIGTALRDFGGSVFEQATWHTVKRIADVVSPGAGLIVAAAYVAIKAVGAARTVNRGDGLYVMFPAEVPGIDIAVSVGVRQTSDSFGVRFRVDLMEHVYVEDAPCGRPTHVHHDQWPGEWTMRYGWAGIRDHSSVLAPTARIVWSPDGSPMFADERNSENSVDWEVLVEQRTCKIALPGWEAVEFCYDDDPSGRHGSLC